MRTIRNKKRAGDHEVGDRWSARIRPTNGQGFVQIFVDTIRGLDYHVITVGNKAADETGDKTMKRFAMKRTFTALESKPRKMKDIVARFEADGMETLTCDTTAVPDDMILQIASHGIFAK